MNITDPANNSDATAVDFNQLQSACDGDAAMMRELVDLYFDQAGQIMTSLEQAIKGNAVGEVNHLAHKLAGSSLACGMSAVVPSLRKLEAGARAGHLIGAGDLFADVTARMKVVHQRVQDYLLQPPAQ